jgi:hypothetical protein
VPGWNQQAIEYYRDRFLIWPVILFSVLTIANLVEPESPSSRLYAFKLAACAAAAVLLTKDRITTILAAALFIAGPLIVGLIVTRNRIGYGIALLIVVCAVIALLPAIRRGKPSYEYEESKNRYVGLLFVMAGMVASVTVVLLLKPK